MRILIVFVLVLGACAHSAPSAEEIEALSGALAVNEGATVADIGAGKGDVAIALAREIVPRGAVLATEIDSGLRADIKEATSNARVKNVSVLNASEKSTGLPAQCCEGIVMRRVYHHLTEPGPTLEGVVAALRDEGRFVVIDFRPSWTMSLSKPEGLPEDRDGHGIDPAIVRREVEAAGLVFIQAIDPWPGPSLLDSFALVFEKPAEA